MSVERAELQLIQNSIYTIRGLQVMLDADLAEFYGVETRVFNQAVKRNAQRFPDRFMFELTEEEWKYLKSQSVMSSGHGGRRTRPKVFTEQGVSMLSAALKSDTAIEVSIRLIDAFVEMRKYLGQQLILDQRLTELEKQHLRFRTHTNTRFVGKASGKRRENVGKTAEKVLALCEANPVVTIAEMAKKIDVSERSIERNISNLQEWNLLRRVGGRKEGRWEVIQNESHP